MDKLYAKKIVLYWLSILMFFTGIHYFVTQLGQIEIAREYTSVIRIFLILVTAYLLRKNNIYYTFMAKYRLSELPIFAIIFIGIYGVYTHYQYGENDEVSITLFFLSCIITGFFEELFFRVLIFALAFRTFIEKNISNQFRAILIASALFSLIHIVNFFNQKMSVDSCVNQMIFAFYFGILLQSLYIKFGSLLFIAFLHGFINFYGGYQQYFSKAIERTIILNQEIGLENWTSWGVSFLFGAVIIMPISYFIIRSEKDFSIR